MIKHILLSIQQNGNSLYFLKLLYIYQLLNLFYYCISVELDTLLSDHERNIYELVTRHFIASCSQVIYFQIIYFSEYNY